MKLLFYKAFSALSTVSAKAKLKACDDFWGLVGGTNPRSPRMCPLRGVLRATACFKPLGHDRWTPQPSGARPPHDRADRARRGPWRRASPQANVRGAGLSSPAGACPGSRLFCLPLTAAVAALSVKWRVSSGASSGSGSPAISRAILVAASVACAVSSSLERAAYAARAMRRLGSEA
jgi:hypothetical protein